MSNRLKQTGRVALLATLACTVLLVANADGAEASCLPPVGVTDAMNQADVVVVGTVASARSNDRIATVRVEERWKGDVGRSFEAFGGPVTVRSATSVDRTYEVGGRYLLFIREPQAHGESATFGGRYEDNACSSTQRWSEALGQYRPGNATVYAHTRDAAKHASDDHASRAKPAGISAAIAIFAVTVGRWARGRRRAAATTSPA